MLVCLTSVCVCVSMLFDNGNVANSMCDKKVITSKVATAIQHTGMH